MPKAKPARRANAAAAAPTDTAPDVDDGAGDITALRALRARLPANSDVLTRAFTRQFPAARCLATGLETRGDAVLRESVRVVLDAERKLGDSASVGYDRTRLRHLLDCVTALGELVREQNLARGTTGLRRTEQSRAQAEARTVRATLVQKLKAVALGDDKATAAVSQALAATDATVSEAAVLEALAAAAQAWLKRKDPESAALASAHRLERADAEHALTIAAELRQADAALRGAAPSVRDSPEVNRCEGRVILEVGVLDDALLAAKLLDPSITELPLGRALRRVLRSHGSSAKAHGADGGGAPGAAAGDGAGAATPGSDVGAGSTKPGAVRSGRRKRGRRGS
jgi:hypothetical protein